MFIPITYTEAQIEELGTENLVYPFTDKDAVYDGKLHQYELTNAYFQERGRNLEVEIDGNEPDKVKNFLKYLRMKVYTRIYNHNKSTSTAKHFWKQCSLKVATCLTTATFQALQEWTSTQCKICRLMLCETKREIGTRTLSAC